MAYESLPMDEAEQKLLTDFESRIYNQIQERGDDNHEIDRYSTKSGIPISIDPDYTYKRTGKIDFGKNFITHRLDVEEFQIVYAFKPRTIYKINEWEELISVNSGRKAPETDDEILPVIASLYVHEFSEMGHGNVARTSFDEGSDKSSIFKSRVTLFGSNLLELHRPLSPSEVVDLEAVIENPEESVVAIRSLVALSESEREEADRALKERAEREEEYRRIMEANAELHREPLPDFLIG